jgi:hypothetical protein
MALPWPKRVMVVTPRLLAPPRLGESAPAVEVEGAYQMDHFAPFMALVAILQGAGAAFRP